MLDLKKTNELFLYELQMHANVIMIIFSFFLIFDNSFAKFMKTVFDFDSNFEIVNVKNKIDVCFVELNRLFVNFQSNSCF